MTSSFAGEAFLSQHPPNYPTERILLTLKLLAAVVVWIFVVPLIFRHHASQTTDTSKNDNDGSSPSSASPTSTVQQQQQQKNKSHQQRPSRTRKKTNLEGRTQNKDKSQEQSRQVDDDEAASFSVGLHVIVLSTLCCLASVVWLVMSSPNNSYAARAVFEAPLFTQDECQLILDMAEQAARRNYEMALSAAESSADDSKKMDDNNKVTKSLLEEPRGWQKARHTSYPTTDLNLVTDPFTKEDRDLIAQRLHARLTPLIERTYGVPPSAVRANDMFVVRYDPVRRPSLNMHTDDSDVSFNVLLSDEFEGGGTRFWHRPTRQPFVDVQPTRVGQVILNNALLYHEGLPITHGTRNIFVGFLSVDYRDPLSGQRTGLSVYSSWLSLSWTLTKFKEGFFAALNRLRKTVSTSPSNMGALQHKWTDHKYVRSLFRDLVLVLQDIGDRWADHFHVNLVADKDADNYLAALDAAHRARNCGAASESASTNNDDDAGSGCALANWFRGQQLALDVDGTVASVWSSRRNAESKFKEL